MAYNLTPIKNLTSPDQLATATNTTSGGLWGVLVLAAIYFLPFKIWTARGMDPIQAHIFSSFISTVFAILLWILGVVAWQWSVLSLVLLFGGFVIQKWF